MRPTTGSSTFRAEPGRAPRTLLATSIVSALVAGCFGGGGDGAYTFSKSYGAGGDESAFHAIEASDGGYAFTGQIAGEAGGQLYAAKLDAFGNLEWQLALGVTLPENLSDIEVDESPDGTYCVGGTVRDADGRGDMFIGKVDQTATFVWQTTLDSGGWGGYRYYQERSASEKVEQVRASKDGGCFVYAISKADLVDFQGIGFEANAIIAPRPSEAGDIYYDARSSVVAYANGDGESWVRRVSTRVTVSLFGWLHPTSEGVMFTGRQRAERHVSLDGTEFFNEVTQMQHYSFTGSVLSNRTYDLETFPLVVLPNSGNAWGRDPIVEALIQTDDPEASGLRDGDADDGFLFLDTNRELVKLDRNGSIEWVQSLKAYHLFNNDGLGLQFKHKNAFLYQNEGNDAEALLFVGDNAIAVNLDDGAVRTNLDMGGNVQIIDVREVAADRYEAVIAVDSADRGAVATYEVGPEIVELSRTPLDFIHSPESLLGTRFRVGGYRVHRTLFDESGIAIGNLVTDPGDFSSFGATIAESAPGTFWVAGRISTSVGDRIPYVATIQDGRILWQRTLSMSSMTRGEIQDLVPDGQGGACFLLLGNGFEGNRLRMVGIDRDGALSWQSQEISQLGSPAYASLLRDGAGYLVLASGVAYDRPPPPSDPSAGPTRERGAALIRFDSGGAVVSAYPLDDLIPQHAVRTAGGDLLLVGRLSTDSTAPVSANYPLGLVLRKTDATGNEIWTQQYGFGDAESRDPVRLRELPGGEIAMAFGSSGFLRQGFTPALAEGETQHFGQGNIALWRLDADGNPLWAKIYGGLEDETFHALELTGDGGQLIAGASNSLGERSEAWLLRLGPDGEVNPGCNAFLGEVAGVHIQRAASLPDPLSPVNGAASIVFASPSSASTALPDITAIDPSLITARQCSGNASSGGGVEPVPLSILTLHQGGSIEGLVVSVPPGILCGNDASFCSAGFASGTQVQLAVDDSDSTRFRGWGPGCDEALSNPDRCRARMDADRDVDVFFEPADGSTSRLTVDVSGAGQVFSEADGGIRCRDDATSSDCVEDYPTGQRVRLSAVADPGESFLGWGGDCPRIDEVDGVFVFVDTDRTCTALFSGAQEPRQFALDVSSSLDGQVGSGGAIVSDPAGIDCGVGNACSAAFDEGTLVELATIPSSGSQFLRWSSSQPGSPCDGATTTHVQVTMSRSRDCRAEFVTPGAPLFTLSAGVVLDGAAPAPGGPFGGSVIGDPAGILCGSAGGACSEDYPEGSTVQLSATADSGYGFSSWSGDCSGTVSPILVDVTAAVQCTAGFVTLPPPARPTLTVTVVGNGQVDSNPPGISCGADCTESYTLGTIVTLAAGAPVGSQFQGWSGDCSGGFFTNVVMDANKACTATFTAVTGTARLTISVVGSGTVTTLDGGVLCPGDCVEDYLLGSFARVIVTSDAANAVSWSGDCADLADSRDFVLTMDQDIACTATFDF